MGCARGFFVFYQKFILPNSLDVIINIYKLYFFGGSWLIEHVQFFMIMSKL